MVRKGMMIKASESEATMPEMSGCADAPRVIGAGKGIDMSEMSAIIGMGKDGRKYYIDPSAFTTHARAPVPRTTQLTGMAKPMLGMTQKMAKKGEGMTGGGSALGVDGDVGRPMRGSNKTYGVTPEVEAVVAQKEEKQLTGGGFWGGFMESYADAMGEGRATGGAMCGCEGEGTTGGAKKRGRPAKAKPSKPDGRKARAEIVKKIMKERGVSLSDASKIVKAEGLY